MNPPISFVRALKREFDGRLRIRWSPRRGEWHIEQKVDHEILPPHVVADWDDDAVRARDGFAYVMAVRDGDRMPCRKCGRTIKVPIFQTAEVHCPNCNAAHYAGHFPLGDRLLEYLRRMDPYRGGSERMVEHIRRDHERRLARDEREIENIAENTSREMYRFVTDNPTIRLSGQTRMWKD